MNFERHLWKWTMTVESILCFFMEEKPDFASASRRRTGSRPPNSSRGSRRKRLERRRRPGKEWHSHSLESGLDETLVISDSVSIPNV